MQTDMGSPPENRDTYLMLRRLARSSPSIKKRSESVLKKVETLLREFENFNPKDEKYIEKVQKAFERRSWAKEDLNRGQDHYIALPAYFY